MRKSKVRFTIAATSAVALAKIGLSGPITFESFSSSVVSKDLSNTLGIWRNLWTDNKSMAKSSREYLESKLIKAYS